MRKERKIEKKQNELTPKEKDDHFFRLVVDMLGPLPETLGMLPLPLPWEIITADVSLGDGNGGEWRSGRGGGWEIKNARRGVGSMVIASMREFGGGIWMGFHGP